MIDETHYIAWLIQSSAVFIRPKYSLQMLKMTTSFIFETILCTYHPLEVWKKYQIELNEILVTILLSCIEEWIVFAGSLMGQFALASKISLMPTHDFRMNCHELCTRKGSLFMNIYILVNHSMGLDYKWLHGENTLEQAPRIKWYQILHWT